MTKGIEFVYCYPLYLISFIHALKPLSGKGYTEFEALAYFFSKINFVNQIKSFLFLKGKPVGHFNIFPQTVDISDFGFYQTENIFVVFLFRN
jgi:hypothetical protein